MKNRSVNILTGGGGPAEPGPYLVPSDWTTKNLREGVLAFNAKGGVPSGFTMAEILLSLTIIGVVAAITLPSLTGNINERTWNTQRKALFARFSQAIPLIDSLNTYANGETFVTGELSKVLKINNICDKEHLADCGIV